MNAQTTILLIEDNPSDIRLIREALRDNPRALQLEIAGDGDEALQFLRKEDTFQNCPTPDIILLDLNIPKRSGLELLEIIKTDKCLKTIPVLILSTSTADEDILQAYRRHANCYISKPFALDHFNRAIDVTIDFWTQVVALPPRE